MEVALQPKENKTPVTFKIVNLRVTFWRWRTTENDQGARQNGENLRYVRLYPFCLRHKRSPSVADLAQNAYQKMVQNVVALSPLSYRIVIVPSRIWYPFSRFSVMFQFSVFHYVNLCCNVLDKRFLFLLDNFSCIHVLNLGATMV